MKKILITIFSCIGIATVAYSETMNVNWYVDGSLYDTSTCTVGGDLDLPTAPTKYGHHFVGWSPYRFLKYIESTGTQYINTETIPTITTGASIKFLPTAVHNADNIVFGASNKVGFAGGLPFSLDPFTSWTYFAFGNFKASTYKVTQGISIGTIYEASLNYMNNGKAIVGKSETIIPEAAEMTTQPIYLFGVNYVGSFNSSNSIPGVQIYEFIITENSSIIHDFVPAERLSDNEIGMYDKVTQTFFTNAGTGNFIAGPEITE